jgi:F-type H+-transporting ATPase subunit delta
VRGTSLVSRDAGLRAFEPAVAANPADGIRLARDLYVVVDTLDASGSLRRTLTDPARPGAHKETLVARVFHALDPRVRAAVADFASRRWIRDHDLADALEDAGLQALLIAAEAEGSLEVVENELFRVERTLARERELRIALENRAALPEARVALARAVLMKGVAPVSATLLERACCAPRGRRLDATLEYFIEAAAARRDRIVAHVTVARIIGKDGRARLAAALAERYGREIQVNVTVDPAILGGMRVQVGNDVVDDTIRARLDDARRQLVV